MAATVSVWIRTASTGQPFWPCNAFMAFHTAVIPEDEKERSWRASRHRKRRESFPN